MFKSYLRHIRHGGADGPIENLVDSQAIVGRMAAVRYFKTVAVQSCNIYRKKLVTALLALSILTVHDESPKTGVLMHDGTTFRA